MSSGFELQDGTVPAKEKKREVRIFDSRELFDRDREIILMHNGKNYKLIITKNDKLILN